MRLTFSNNPLDKFSCWFENKVVAPISSHYYSKKKAHYTCAICGLIEAPYFIGATKYASMTKDYGWHKLDNGKWHRWVCHHCADHGFVSASENHNSGFTWDEWRKLIKGSNERLLEIIKEKDPEYYDYWFNGGREKELFGEWEENDE